LSVFFDDLKLTAPADVARDAWAAFVFGTDVFGWVFDEEKDSLMAEQGPFLGFWEDFSQVDSLDKVTLQNKEPFLDRLAGVLDQAVTTRKLPSGDARSLVGKLIHRAEATDGRMGRGQIWAISAHAASLADRVDDVTMQSLLFHQTLLAWRKPRAIYLSGQWRMRCTVYTDAACEPRDPPLLPKVTLCYMGVRDDGQSFGAIATLPDHIVQSFHAKRTYIAHGEAFVVLFALYREAKLLRNTSVVWFMDNLGVLASLCKASSSMPDLSCIVHAIILSCVKLDSIVWWEYVNSSANTADGGTRDSSVVADALGIKLIPKDLPPWPACAVQASVQEWLAWLDQ
jgi:hypothetical protein